MRLSNEVNSLKDCLIEHEKLNNITLHIVHADEFVELKIVDNEHKEFSIEYDLIIKNKAIEKMKLDEIKEMDISNFEIKVISPIDYLQENDIYEYWNLEYELQKFLENRFFM